MTPQSEYERWQEQWQRTAGSQAARAAMPHQIVAARRQSLFARLIESGVAFGALTLTALALRHAANKFEAALGLLVSGGIIVSWARSILLRKQEHAASASNSMEHLAVLRTVRLQQARLAHFVWIVLALESAFLTPWWIVGSRVHARHLMDLASWITVWIPIVVMLAVFVWALRLRYNARSEIRAMDKLLE